MKKFKISLIIFSVFLLIILGFISFLFIAGKDESEPNDAGLRPENVIVKKEENAFYPLMLAGGKINASSEDFDILNDILDKGDIVDMSRVKSIIDKNKQALDIFDQALTYPKFQDEMCKDINGISVNSILYSRPEIWKISKIALLREVYNFKSGREEKAMDQTLMIASLGHRIQNSKCVLIVYLVGQVIKTQALSVFIDFTNQTNLPSSVLRKYITRLSSIEDSRDGLAYSFKLEYLSSINTKIKLFDDFIAKAKVKIITWIPYFYKPNKTERIMVDNYRNIINSANETFFKDIKKESFNMAEIAIPKGNFLVENVVGRMYLNVAMVSFGLGSYSKIAGERFLVSGSQALLALKSYWQDYKKLPNNLSELVPVYLSDVPKDPFDGNLIKYSLSNGILYSVGSDLRDDGGINNSQSHSDSKYLKEPTVRIQFAR